MKAKGLRLSENIKDTVTHFAHMEIQITKDLLLFLLTAACIFDQVKHSTKYVHIFNSHLQYPLKRRLITLTHSRSETHKPFFPDPETVFFNQKQVGPCLRC